LVGFTTASGNDLVYDLGQENSLVNGETWSGLSSLLSSTYGSNLGNLYWGVIGNTANTGTARTAYTTTMTGSVPGTVNQSLFSTLNHSSQTLAQNFSGTTISAGQSATPDTTLDTSWNQETLNGTLSTAYVNAYENPNVQGVTSADFSQMLYTGSAPTLLGSFSLGSDGTFTFNAVPEPTTYSLLVGAGLLAAVLRARRNRVQS
jgi:hypothetical protein